MQVCTPNAPQMTQRQHKAGRDTCVWYMIMFCDKARAPPVGTGISLKVSLGSPEASQIRGWRLCTTLTERAASAIVSFASR